MKNKMSNKYIPSLILLYLCICSGMLISCATKKEIIKDKSDICSFLRKPARELLDYLSMDSTSIRLTNFYTLPYYTDIIVELNKEETIHIHTMPNTHINLYEKLLKENATLAYVQQFPIGHIDYYDNKNKIYTSCSCKY